METEQLPVDIRYPVNACRLAATPEWQNCDISGIILQWGWWAGIVLFVQLALLTQLCYSQEAIKFKHLTIVNGLSQSTVEAIVQDHQGFMWFGTEDGLNRYDGYQFTVYRNDPEERTSLSNNNIWCLYVDKDGFLWIGTYTGGLNRFDPRLEKFDRFLHAPDDSGSISSDAIRSIAQDSSGTLWVATRGGGLNYLPREQNRFSRILADAKNPGGLASNNIRCVYAQSDGTLWIASDNGVNIFDPAEKKFRRLSHDPTNTNSLISDNVRHIYEDRAGMLWLSTANGLSRFHAESEQFTNYLHDSRNPSSISSNNIRKVFQDNRGNIWIATTHGGLNLFNQTENRFYDYRHDLADARSLSNDNVRVVYQDRGGLLWAGTIGGGLNIYDHDAHRFKHFRYIAEEDNSLSHPIVWAISEGPDGDLWFGSNAGGLDRYNRTSSTYRHYQHDPRRSGSLSDNHIRTIYWDRTGRLWIGTRYSGIDIYDPRSDSFANMRQDRVVENSLSNNNIRHIYQDHLGGLWFATWGGGLNHFHPQSQTFTYFRHRPEQSNSLSSDNVIFVCQDSDSAFWVATADGLNRLSIPGFSGNNPVPQPALTEIARYYHDPEQQHSLSNSYVLAIHESQNGDLWIATMQGINRLPLEYRLNPRFERYFVKDGLPNDVIYAVLEDGGGRLWFSTNQGISRFDPQLHIFKNFDIRDGLANNEFNTGACAATGDGRFIFGGVNGADEFHPDSLQDDDYPAPVVLTGFNIYDKPATLASSVDHLEKITLSHRDNYFSFEFAALDFSTPERNQYAYKLQGFDQEWQNAGNRRFAGYTHLDAGDYVFKVKGTNGDGVWNERVREIHITITPPFWKTWWFMLAIVLFAGGGIALAIIYRVRQLLAIERLRTRIAADLHDDIGAGLSEISILGEVITQNLVGEINPEVSQGLDKIGRRSRQLIDSMSDIVWLVNPRRDSLFDLISRLGSTFETHLLAAGIRFNAENVESLKKVRLNMEVRQHLFLIFKEALHNAIKYSNGNTIDLLATVEARHLSMQLRDNGRGFDAAMTSTGNGINNMKKRANLIGGTLSIETGDGKGTLISFRGLLR